MTIDEAIKQAEETAEYNQYVVDTHHITDDISLDELYADDTEIIEEHLIGYKKYADDYRQLAEWLKDYKRLLEQQTCEYCVSRQAVLDLVNSDWEYEGLEVPINCLPSVTPTTNWIPVSERLPEQAGEYFVTYRPYHWGETFREHIRVGVDSFRGKTTWAKNKYQKVIAWMPLPKPYNAESEE